MMDKKHWLFIPYALLFSLFVTILVFSYILRICRQRRRLKEQRRRQQNVGEIRRRSQTRMQVHMRRPTKRMSMPKPLTIANHCTSGDYIRFTSTNSLDDSYHDWHPPALATTSAAGEQPQTALARRDSLTVGSPRRGGSASPRDSGVPILSNSLRTKKPLVQVSNQSGKYEYTGMVTRSAGGLGEDVESSIYDVGHVNPGWDSMGELTPDCELPDHRGLHEPPGPELPSHQYFELPSVQSLHQAAQNIYRGQTTSGEDNVPHYNTEQMELKGIQQLTWSKASVVNSQGLHFSRLDALSGPQVHRQQQQQRQQKQKPAAVLAPSVYFNVNTLYKDQETSEGSQHNMHTVI